MKKLLAAVLMVCCVFAFSSSAFAGAKLTVTQKKLITFEGDWDGYFFAKVENTGDEPTYVDYGGKLVGFDAEDNIILTENYVLTYPSRILLRPGEYAYLREYILETELKTSTVADYKFTIKTQTRGDDYDKIPSEAVIDYNGGGTYKNYVYVTLTNTTDTIMNGYTITVAIFDQNGDLIFVDGDSFSTLGIHPGSTVTLRMSIDNDLAEYYDRNSITPTTVESIVYVSK